MRQFRHQKTYAFKASRQVGARLVVDCFLNRSLRDLTHPMKIAVENRSHHPEVSGVNKIPAMPI